MKITIIGLSGSGKTTLTKKISEAFDLPKIDLDRFWFQGGGPRIQSDTATDEEKEQVRLAIEEKVLAEIAKPNWVSDGFHSWVQDLISEKADVIIYLDKPTWKRLLNHAARILHGKVRHPELSPWQEIKFFPQVIKHKNRLGPKIQELVEQYDDKVVWIKSRKQLDGIMETIQEYI